ncbi:hypothetical protein BGW80DRAFT_1319285, partial [Lactifluus volemus]
MRFSVFTLLIVLPAAAYAAVCPQQFSIQSRCGGLFDFCDPEFPCCASLECVQYVPLEIESARHERELSRTGC